MELDKERVEIDLSDVTFHDISEFVELPLYSSIAEIGQFDGHIVLRYNHIADCSDSRLPKYDVRVFALTDSPQIELTAVDFLDGDWVSIIDGDWKEPSEMTPAEKLSSVQDELQIASRAHSLAGTSERTREMELIESNLRWQYIVENRIKYYRFNLRCDGVREYFVRFGPYLFRSERANSDEILERLKQIIE